MHAYHKAEKFAAEVTLFWASAVGKGINRLEEFSLLVEWHEAIEEAKKLALSLRDWVAVDDFDAMQEECEMWLSLN
jgi:hypothetical protein